MAWVDYPPGHLGPWTATAGASEAKTGQLACPSARPLARPHAHPPSPPTHLAILASKPTWRSSDSPYTSASSRCRQANSRRQTAGRVNVSALAGTSTLTRIQGTYWASSRCGLGGQTSRHSSWHGGSACQQAQTSGRAGGRTGQQRDDRRQAGGQPAADLGLRCGLCHAVLLLHAVGLQGLTGAQ